MSVVRARGRQAAVSGHDNRFDDDGNGAGLDGTCACSAASASLRTDSGSASSSANGRLGASLSAMHDVSLDMASSY